MRRPLVRLFLAVPLCGVLVAGLLTAGWIVLGRPTPAKGATWFQVIRVGDSEYTGAPDKPFFFLALGNDGRSDTDPGLGDAIHVIGVNPAMHQATILNVPRDTTAPAGDKINAYHSLHGLPGIVDQLNKMMGINISYAITTNFPGISSMVDEIGGIDVNITQTFHDTYSGAFFNPGPQHLTGDQFLRYARDRHDWTNGDITRTANQAYLILASLTKLRAENPGEAGTLGLVAILARHVRMMNLDMAELWRLGQLAMSIDPATIKTITIPVGSGPGSNLVLGPGAQQLFADFADDGIVESAG
jgi:LCP family protein required for cell wall assembly